MRDFREDIVDLFDRKRGGHVQHWLYTDALRDTMSGADLWRAFTRSSQRYYIPEVETRLIREKGPTMISSNEADTLVDFGVGSKSALIDKVMPVIRSLRSLRMYSGIDISQHMLEIASKTVEELRPELEIEMQQKDFHYDPICCGGKKHLGIVFGCSVSNQEMMEGDGFPDEAIVNNLRHYREHLSAGDEMLVTYDMNPDEQKVKAAYDDPYWSRHVTGLMYDVDRLLKTDGDFDPTAWRHEMIWNDQVQVMHQCIVAEKAQSLIMGDRTFRFNQHQRFVAVNNFKFREADFERLCVSAGFQVGRSEAEDSLRLQHLRI